MESNWRFNVWDIGLWGSGAVLAARILNYPLPGTWYLVSFGPESTYRKYHVVPGQPPDHEFDAGNLGPFPENDEGLIVSPD